MSISAQKGIILWLTGLSGAGKSTLANAVKIQLDQSGYATVVLDGDIMRAGLNSDLGFSMQDRAESLRRTTEVAKLFLRSGKIVIVACISPMQNDRVLARSRVGSCDFIEIFCNCPLEVCETRDVKGLYKKARRNELANFTGISAPYEAPSTPELNIDTGSESISSCTEQIIRFLKHRDIISHQ